MRAVSVSIIFSPYHIHMSSIQDKVAKIIKASYKSKVVWTEDVTEAQQINKVLDRLKPGVHIHFCDNPDCSSNGQIFDSRWGS